MTTLAQKIYTLIFFALLLPPFDVVFANSAIDCNAVMEKELGQSEFKTGRDLYQYKTILGADFVQALDALPKESHLLDLGGGDGLAAEEISSAGKRVTLVAYAAKVPATSHDGLLALYGRFFEDIPNAEMTKLGKVVLAIDLWGVAAYTTRIRDALEKVHELLSEGGEYFVTVGTRRPEVHESWTFSGTKLTVDSSMYSSEVILKNGKQMPLPTYLRRYMKGFDIRESGGSRDALIFKKNGQPFSLPRLEYLGNSSSPKILKNLTVFKYSKQKPPGRLFRELD